MARTFLFGVLLWCLAAPGVAATIVVDLEGAGDFTDIQSAVDAASGGDTVLVKAGEFVILVPITFRGKTITVKAEGGPELTTIKMSPEPADAARASVVIFETGEPRAALLEGFTITGGKGTRYGPEFYEAGGGGLLFLGTTSATAKDCVVTRNTTASYGGGVHCARGASPRLVGCKIAWNVATEGGGGVYAVGGAAATLERCTISWNQANHGGGIACALTASMTAMNCTLTDNGASYGAAASFQQCTAALEHCTIAGNLTEETYSGAIVASSATVSLESSIVWDNSGGSIGLPLGESLTAAHSCIEGPEVWPGQGNTNESPRFAGWGPASEVHVDAANPQPGDGTRENPFRELRSALNYSLALAPDSPCLGAGEGGSDMGAATGTGPAVASPTRLVRVARGGYGLAGLSFSHGASLEGAGPEETVLTGTVLGLRSGSHLSKVTVTGGTAGGVRVTGGESVEIKDCTIAGNQGQHGGGICCIYSPLLLERCSITGNSASLGGGIYAYGSAIIVRDSRIEGNRALGYANEGAGDGGGVYCTWGNDVPRFFNCVVAGNWAQWSGGGFSVLHCDVLLSGCDIRGNAALWGGGCFLEEHERAQLVVHCSLVGNSAEKEGGGVFCKSGSSASFRNCTIAGNAAETGGGIHCGQLPVTRPSFTNCIIWDNSGGTIGLEDRADPVVSHSCVEGESVWPGEGNINVSPSFEGWGQADEVYVDASAAAVGDGTEASPYRDLGRAFDFSYSLAAGSPCRGSGQGGADMGADRGTAAAAGAPRRRIHLRPGRYSLRGLGCTHHVSLSGERKEETVLEGTLFGLRTDESLSGVTVTQGRNGGIRIGAGEAPRVADCIISGNEAFLGGGVAVAIRAAPTLTSCAITANRAGDGGGLWCTSASPRLEGCIFGDNAAEQFGGGAGGVGGEGTPQFTACTFSGNTAGWDGGGLWFGGIPRVTSPTVISPVLKDCVVQLNSARTQGGGAYLQGGYLERCAVSQNVAERGGGVYCSYMPPTLLACSITGNKAAEGGGAYCEQGNVWSCTVAGNWATGAGGGLFLFYQAAPSLMNCVVYGNRAAGGSGLHYWGGEPVAAWNCTITGNQADPGGGVISCKEGVPYPLWNSILWDNDPGTACAELFSCVSEEDPLFVSGGTFDFERFEHVEIGGTPQELPDFILEEPDLELREGSPCVDRGSPQGAPDRDARGLKRPCGDGVDVGAHERGGCPLESFLRGDADGSGFLNITDPIFVLTFLFLGGAVLPCSDAADVDASDTLEITDAIFSLSYLFLGGPAPASPFPACGIDERMDTLACASSSGCRE